jgi:hypothetical protein
MILVSIVLLIATMLASVGLLMHIKLVAKIKNDKTEKNTIICTIISSVLSVYGLIGHVIVYHNFWNYNAYDIDYIALVISIYYVFFTIGAYITYK